MNLETVIDEIILGNPDVACAWFNPQNEVIDVFYDDGSVGTLCDNGKGEWFWVIPEENRMKFLTH